MTKTFSVPTAAMAITARPAAFTAPDAADRIETDSVELLSGTDRSPGR